MRPSKSFFLPALSVLSFFLIAGQGSAPVNRQAAQTLLKQGNYAEAYEQFSRMVLGQSEDPGSVGEYFTNAVKCLTRLNRQEEIDPFREKAVARHGDNWRLLLAAAKSLDQGESSGHQVGGEFVRGHVRCTGPNVSARARDRVRALQLLVQAFPAANNEKDRAFLSPFYKQIADLLMDNRTQGGSWRLQYLTDLNQLPDFDEPIQMGPNLRAPVDEKGDPVFHYQPSDWGTARSDGERWRWALAHAEKADPAQGPVVKRQFADFLSDQFGVETMAEYQWFFGRSGEIDEKRQDTTGIWQVHTLGEDETIAKLAGGVKRFQLPPEFNYIALYKELKAYERLAVIFENRRQYPRAAEYWKKVPPGAPIHPGERLRQIVGPWGEFESAGTQAAGQEPRVDFRFRNGRQVRFEARAINVDGLLEDVKTYLKSSPTNLHYNRLNIENIGYRLVTKGGDKYLGERVAAWDLSLDPRPNHFDRRTTVKLPFRKGGAYLLTARMKDGNTTRIVLWLADLALIEKPVNDGRFFFLADAQTGRPAGAAQLDLFGYQTEYVNVPRGKDFSRVLTKEFTEKLDGQGQLIVKEDRLGNNFQWLGVAKTSDGKSAFLGFDYYWHSQLRDEESFNQTKAFIVTDRPVYRPKQNVRFKVWGDQAGYDREGGSPFAGKPFMLEIYDPAGKKLVNKSYTADEFGGFSGELPLEEGAKLGVYSIRVDINSVTIGEISFRVEEYKKPEFEVKVEAPEESVQLGEKVKAKITAAYYFGAPVTEAMVKYKVLRSEHDVRWYPEGPWDWYYGRGYGWLAPDYPWWPGWRDWGCERPFAWWWGNNRGAPPELVAEREAPIGPKGTLEIPIDTSLALAVHPDQDHRYEITVEVTDHSRRTIVGQGSVLVTRKPFKVYAWVDRGHYESGDTVQAQFIAQTADQKPIADASARAVLYQVSYDNKTDQPKESPVEEWELKTDAEGRLQVKIKAVRPGQYRLVGTVTDVKKRTLAGGCVFVVRGEGKDAKGFRFNDLELIPDRPTYATGETAKLMVNTAQPNSHVLLFLRPSDGLYEKPALLTMDGQSSVNDIMIQKRDMPNFFVEAITVSGGKIHTETREIIVPPENRILNVQAIPSAKSYKPGQKADIKFRVTDQAGKPFQGSLALSVYDKSVEYISGGSNVGDIREFFWKWRRRHYPATTCNLTRETYPVHPSGETAMGFLGVFGHGVADVMPAGTSEWGDPEDMSLMLDSSGGRLPIAPQSMAPSKMLDPREQTSASTPLVSPVVRRQFADTAHWVARLDTDVRGEGRTQFTMPDNLTTWKTRVWAMGSGARCGEGTVEVVTAKKLLLRLQAPRFFVQKDEVVLSANVHNYLAGSKKVRVSLELEGKTLEILSPLKDQNVVVPSQGEKRVDWRVRVTQPGEAVVRMKALTDEESDAAEMRFPVYVHGMSKTESFCGAIRPLETVGSFDLRVPKERRPEETRLEIRYSPSLALAMVDALPYLVDYPYGCTEQTLNRFLPTIITQRTLQRMGIRLSDVREKITNLNAQEIGEDAKRQADWKRLAGEKRWDGENWVDRNPVFDEGKAEDMAKAGVEKLTAMQNEDGGWGWFSGSMERSYPHTTAQVVHGLQIARANGVAFDPGVLKRGAAWLERYQNERVDRLAKVSYKKEANASADDLDAFVYMVTTDEKRNNLRMGEFLYRDRAQLSVYAKALFGLGLHTAGRMEERDMLIRNIRQYLVRDDENQTAYLRLGNEGYWWHWYGSEMEAHAYFLKLLAVTDPQGDTGPRLVKYMLNNRRHATYWNSTRDTALVVEAFADYLKATGEDRPDMTVEIQLDGRTLKKVAITPDNLFAYDNKLVVKGADLADGAHKLALKKTGAGPLYWNAYLTNFTLEDPIEKAGLEIKVDRAYFKLIPQEKTVKDAGSRGQVVDRKVEKFKRIPLKNMDELKSGDRVLVELTVESKNDYEYIVLEDPKPAGFEPVELQSGYAANGAYMELRDEKVALFLRVLARGRQSLSYELRAEIPGRFSALPTRATAMYAPELRANANEFKLRVAD